MVDDREKKTHTHHDFQRRNEVLIEIARSILFLSHSLSKTQKALSIHSTKVRYYSIKVGRYRRMENHLDVVSPFVTLSLCLSISIDNIHRLIGFPPFSLVQIGWVEVLSTISSATITVTTLHKDSTGKEEGGRKSCCAMRAS
jgi:hypothetical protein